MPVFALGSHQPLLPPPDRVWIAPDAAVIGRVSHGNDVGLWFGAVLRGDNDPIVVGDETNIQDGAILHTDHGFPLLIGRGCTVGHRAIVHGCTVGDNTLIGMGATIMNGARIGANCMVGANALVTENKVFPDNSLIMGGPARLLRQLEAAEVASLRRFAETYVGNGRRFRAELRRLD